MTNGMPRGWISAFAWLVFPVIPVVLEEAYASFGNIDFSSSRYGPDPYDWPWQTWYIMLGPLVGYGFLAGATLGIPDEPEPRRLRRWMSRRAVWVCVGPWVGALAALGLALLVSAIDWIIRHAFHFTWAVIWQPNELTRWLNGLLLDGLFAIVPSAWLAVAFVAVRRAARSRRAAQALWRGLAGAVGFAGSLFGSFWAATSVWRAYFFDTTIVRLSLVALASITLVSGCASTTTAGDLRRRSLFHAMLLAWVLGLALAWRWWSRARKRGR
jgi:hypothetical protein